MTFSLKSKPLDPVSWLTGPIFWRVDHGPHHISRHFTCVPLSWKLALGCGCWNFGMGGCCWWNCEVIWIETAMPALSLKDRNRTKMASRLEVKMVQNLLHRVTQAFLHTNVPRWRTGWRCRNLSALAQLCSSESSRFKPRRFLMAGSSTLTLGILTRRLCSFSDVLLVGSPQDVEPGNSIF